MTERDTLGAQLRAQGVSRRGFLKFCAATASMMALPPAMVPRIAAALEAARRPSVIWLSFQECTGCTESLTRSHTPTIENLIFDSISLDYHHTLQAAAGYGAEEAREEAMREHHGKYLLVVDGSIPTKDDGVYSTIAGMTNLAMLEEAAAGAAAIIAVGTCAAFGGLPHAKPNPTGAKAVSDIIHDKPIINVSGCPPIPVVITGVLAHFLTFGTIPDLDHLGRPKAFFGQNIHDRCYRRPYYLRRSGREKRLVSVPAWLQGAGHLQRLCDDEVESGHELPDRVRARLHRLFGTQLLGYGRAVPIAVAGQLGGGRGPGRSRGHRCRGGHRLVAAGACTSGCAEARGTGPA